MGGKGLNHFLSRIVFTLFSIIGCVSTGFSQHLFINEVQSSNISTIYDHTGITPDWLEVFNASASAIDLQNYGLSDVDSLPLKWTFPSVILGPQSHILVYASGLNLKEAVLHWETLIDIGDDWKYHVPTSELPSSWKSNNFDDSGWQSGKSGLGYGDGDDSTILDVTMSVFIRKQFTVMDFEDIKQAFLHIDFDDAFVAYLNGVEVARANIGQQGVVPAYNDPAENYNHEAKMYSGGFPDEFFIDEAFQYLINGENVLAIQIHNHSISSSDLSAIPIFTVGNAGKPAHEIDTSPYINLVPIGLHTNFKISSAGEPLILSDQNGNQIDSIFTSNIPANISLGRKPDGNNQWMFFDEPTPGYANISNGYSPIPVSSVQFSISGGFYSGIQNLELYTSNQLDSIFYTLDGSEPSKEGLYYSSDISIAETSVVKARVMLEGHLPGKISTESYLINNNHDLPTVFVNTDPTHLWDEEYGIYVKGPNAESDFPFKGANFWQDWERPANIAMFEPDGSLAFQIDAGIKIFGAYSRGQDQKSLSIHCRKSYGHESIDYKIFQDRDLDVFKTIILRNSGNDFNNTMLRDAFCSSIVSDFDLDYQAYRPAVVYLNGDYWGIHNIREKINEEFIASHHKINEDEIDILEADGQVVRGNAEHYDELITFLRSNNLAVTENYNQVKAQVDIDNFIKYQIAEIFIDNRDWPGNNIKFWRERKSGRKWRWILFDLDFGLNTWGNDNQLFNTLDFALEPNGPEWPNPPWSTFLLRKLMENETFKNDFINYFADNLNTIFDPLAMESKLNELKAEIQKEIPYHLNRWNGSIGYWNDRISAMKSFIRDRRGLVRNHIQSEFNLSGMYNTTISVEGGGHVTLNTIELTKFPWDGKYFNDIPITLTAVPKSGHRFLKWEGIETNNNETITLSPNAAITVTAVFGPSEITNDQIVINEINYNSSIDHDSGDWIELLNTSDHAINISGWSIKDNDDTHEFLMPEGTVIDSYSYLVVCKSLEKFLAEFPKVRVINEEMSFGFGSSGDCVRLFNSNGSMMDIVCYESDSPWPTEANGMGSTLALLNASSNNEHPLNWKASFYTGTPGSKNDVITSVDKVSSLRFIEVYPNPTQDNINIEIDGPFEDDISVSILDMAGRRRIVKTISPLVQEKNVINISLHQMGLDAGIYVISVDSNTGIRQYKILLQ